MNALLFCNSKRSLSQSPRLNLQGGIRTRRRSHWRSLDILRTMLYATFRLAGTLAVVAERNCVVINTAKYHQSSQILTPSERRRRKLPSLGRLGTLIDLHRVAALFLNDRPRRRVAHRPRGHYH